MNLLDFKDVILQKSTGRTVLPDDAVLGERIFVGLKKIAMDTVPLILVENEESMEQMIRRLDLFTFVRMPFKPEMEEDEIDTDDMLIDALSYYVLAGLEQSKAKTYMGMYYGEIETNNNRLIETELSVADNDSERFNQFP